MVIILSTDELVKTLRAFKRLEKRYVVKVKRSRTERRTSRYALVKVCAGGDSVIVPYEILRKFLERLPGQQVTIDIRPDGLRVFYRHGELFLRQICGEWKDLAEVRLGA